MEKTKIPILKKFPVSSIPVPIKSNGTFGEKKTKTQLKLPPAQVSLTSNAKISSKRIVSNSAKMSENIEKVPKRLTSSKTQLSKNTAPVPNNKLKAVQKFSKQGALSKPATISLKPAVSSVAKRIPPPASVCNQKRPPLVEKVSKTLSTNQRVLQKPASSSQKSASANIIKRIPPAENCIQKKTFSAKKSNTFSKNEKIISQPRISVKSAPSNALRVPLCNQKRPPAEKKLKPFVEKKSKPFAKVQPMTQKPKANQALEHVNISEPDKLAQKIVAEDAEAPVIIEQKEIKPNLDDNDSEFKASNFFKNLILSERELSPGIIKLCSDGKFTSMGANMKTLVKKSNYFSADLVENLRRMSAKHRNHGSRQYSPYVTHKSSPFKVARNLLSVKENLDAKLTIQEETSGLRQKILEKSISRPEVVDRRWTCNNILTNTNAKKINVAELRRMSEIQRQSLFHGQNKLEAVDRRWTCNNILSNASAKKINVSELRRLSEIQRRSIYQEQNKHISFLSPHPISHLISRLTPVTKDPGFLLSKRKNKLQKKVTFNIPSINSPDSLESVKGDKNNFKKSCLTNIDDGSNQMVTSKSDINTNTRTIESENCVTNKTTLSEFNVNSVKYNSDLFLKRISEEKQNAASEGATPEFDLKLQGNEQLSKDSNYGTNNTNSDKYIADNKDTTPEFNLFSFKYCSNLLSKATNVENPKIERQSATPEFDLKILGNDQLTKNSKSYLNVDAESSSTLSSNPSIKVDISDNVFQEKDIPSIQCPSCDNTPPPKMHCASPFVPKCSPSVIQSLEELAITSPQYASKTKTFLLNPEQNIYTPRPISLHQNSYSRNSFSPFLAERTEALCPFAPICTPFVLKNMANINEVNLSPVRQKLNFSDEPKLSNERRESQIIIQSIPTFQKMQDCLCDQECNILSMQSTTTIPIFRLLQNPIAKILNHGDDMHFVPLSSP